MPKNREKFNKKVFRLVGELQRNNLIATVLHLPIDEINPLCVTVGEEVKARKLDQNALYWSGPLKDISEQVYIQGRTYNADVLHEYFKDSFLPDVFDHEICKDGYVKYDYTPSGKRILIGSTTQLTIKGFSEFLEQVYAFGASHGVEFHTRDN